MNTETPRRSGPHAPLPAAISSAPAPEQPMPQVVKSGVAAKSEEDPRIRAARRAAELREHGSLDDGNDKFYIDPKIIPDGWSYEYKMFTVLGKEDPSYQVQLRQNGWEPVPVSRHPELMPVGYEGNTIIRDGQMLMERPLEITEERKQRDRRNAREQVQAKEEQLGAAPAGTFERNNKGEKLATIKKSYESIPIPKE